MYLVEYCTPENVSKVWDHICDDIQIALNHNMGELTLQDVYEGIYEGKIHLVIIFKDLKAIASCTIEFVQYPQMKVMNIITLSGKGMKEWMKSLQRYLEIGAINEGASRISSLCRKGFSRMLTPLGYSAQYILVSKSIGG